MTIHTSILPSMQEQFDSFRAQSTYHAPFMERVLESDRLTREDLTLLKSFAHESNKKLDLVAEILALHYRPKVDGLRGPEHYSWAGQSRVFTHAPDDSLHTHLHATKSDELSRSAINNPLVVS